MLLLIISIMSSLLSKELSLYIGQEYRIDAQQIKKIIITNSNIIQAKQKEEEIILKAKAEGKSKAKIIKNDLSSETIEIQVTKEVSPQIQSVYKILKSIPNIKTSINEKGNKISIKGITSNQRDYKLIKKFSNEYKFINSSVKLKKLGKLKDRITTNLLDIGAYNISIINSAGIYFIEASTRTEEAKKNVLLYINKNLRHFKANIKIIPYQVDIDVKIIETTKDETKNYGIDFPSSIAISGHSIMSAIDLESVLYFGKTKGRTKVLYNPSLSTNDGETADFHAGGSIPIKLESQFSSDLVWKNYGVILKFTPKVIRDDIINIDISSEFSSLAGSTEDNNIPSILIRKVNTSVTVKDGKAIIISGLIQKMFHKNKSGIPILSDIPIISSIFSKNNNSKTKTELLIIVTPRLRLQYDERLIDQELDSLLNETIQRKK